MDSFQKDIDERANLALSNKFELLLFRLGASQHDSKSELYGINVFKLREIVPMQKSIARRVWFRHYWGW